MNKSVVLGVVAILAFEGGRGVGNPQELKGHVQGRGVAIYPPVQIRWVVAPPLLPPGAKVAALEGDPSKEGPFVLRVWMPDGYRIPPHTHPRAERVTVISGTFHVGMGDRFDASKGLAMPAGTFGTWPAGMKHFVWAKGETVIQLHGTGPWSLTYLDPRDDPRNAKK
jgi:quercetin dioxygenase-like cupin family protein